MRTSARRMGNSAGIILPKPVLTELGVKAGDDLSLTLKKGRIIVVPAKAHPPSGWAAAPRGLAESADDRPVWPEFANEGDDALIW